MNRENSRRRRPASGNTKGEKVKVVLKRIWEVLVLTSKMAYKTRSVLLAIPVGVCAVVLALRNLHLLPETVAMHIPINDGYQLMLSRGAAAMLPLGLTAVCLLLMFISKRTLYPWLISVFSLALPLVIWVISMFPG